MRTVRPLAILVVLVLAGLAAASPAPAMAQTIYGSQLMTEEERLLHRERMRSAQSEEEREQIRLEHHKEMQQRAQKLGIELPDEPPAAGMGKGSGQGQGMGLGLGKKKQSGAP